jgi:hypothetical protein
MGDIFTWLRKQQGDVQGPQHLRMCSASLEEYPEPVVSKGDLMFPVSPMNKMLEKKNDVIPAERNTSKE